MPSELVQALRSTAAHSTLVLGDSNSTAILPDGSLGKGVADVEVARSEDNDCSRLETSHDGYVKGFGLIHQRRLSLGNDGKEVRGEDRLIPRGRKKIREAAPYAIRFHLAPGVEATVTADGMGAIIRSSGAPPWNFRCRGAMLQVEESLFIDGRGQPRDLAAGCGQNYPLLAAKSPGSSALKPIRDPEMTDIVPIRRALISLSDKTGLTRWPPVHRPGRAGVDWRDCGVLRERPRCAVSGFDWLS
jgi:hypothetical protein